MLVYWRRHANNNDIQVSHHPVVGGATNLALLDQRSQDAAGHILDVADSAVDLPYPLPVDVYAGDLKSGLGGSYHSGHAHVAQANHAYPGGAFRNPLQQ